MELLRWPRLGESKDSKEKRIEFIRNQVLFSPELLENIFEKLDLPRQKGCRLTSTLWNQVIFQLFQRKISKALVRIRREEDCVEFRAVMESGDHKDSLDPYPFPLISLHFDRDTSIDSTTCLCSNFKIVELTCSVALDTEMAAKHAMSILTGSASTLRRLCIPYLGNWDDNDDDEAQSSSELHFPQLEVLKLLTRHTGVQVSPPTAQQTVDFFARIISAAPRLKSLDITHLRQCLPGFLEQSTFSTVQKLDLVGHNWDLLGREKFSNLKELTWKLSASSIEPPQISQVLSQFSGSFQRLYVTWGLGSGEGQHPTSFPFCPALTQLEVDVLQVDSVSWENFPNLRVLRFKRIHQDLLELSSPSNNFKTCPSIRKVSYQWMGNSNGPQKTRDFFPKLFLRFPNVTDWRVHYKDVFQFCKTAAMASEELHVQKLSVYLPDRVYCFGDKDMICQIDRYTFSLLPNLHELEELVLNNGGERYGSQMIFSQIDFSKLPKLRRLKVYNDSDPAQKECEALKGIHQVCMTRTTTWYGPKGKGKQPGMSILSAPNVVFRKVPYKCR